MSDIPRYKPVANDKFGIADDADGKLCEYRDYARLKAEVERLKAEVNYRKNMDTHIKIMADQYTPAKEGKPSV